jgi:putative peptidoglycan lipid II flippase
MLAQGSLTYLNYAFRLMHLPIGLFGVAVGTVSLPQFSKDAAENRLDHLKDSLVRAMNTATTLTVPSSLLLIVLALPLTRLAYERGSFNFLNSLNTSGALVLYSLGIWASAEIRNLANSFYALKDSRTPTFVGLGSVALNALLALSLMWKFGFRGLACATSVATLVNCFTLMFLLHRRIGGWGVGKVLVYLVKILAVSAAAAGIAFGLSWLLKLNQPHTGFIRLLVGVVLSGAVGVGVFYLAARIFHITEVDEFLKKFRR